MKEEKGPIGSETSTPGQVKYIKATKKHIHVLVDYRMFFSDELVGVQDASTERNLRNRLAVYFRKQINKTCFSWFATVNGEVASIACMCVRVQPGNVINPSGVWGYIMGVYTVPKYRRKGLSTQLLQKLTGTARELGITALELHASAVGEPVYIKEGFKKHYEPTYRKFL